MKTNIATLRRKKNRLQKMLNEVVEQESRELIEQNYPNFAKFKGQFFKRKQYESSNASYYYVYLVVLDVPKDALYVGRDGMVFSYCTTYQFWVKKNNAVYFTRDESTYCHDLGKKITKSEFVAARTLAFAYARAISSQSK